MGSSMEEVTLQTPQDLTSFRKLIHAKEIKTGIRSLPVACECSEEAIALAIYYFGIFLI